MWPASCQTLGSWEFFAAPHIPAFCSFHGLLSRALAELFFHEAHVVRKEGFPSHLPQTSLSYVGQLLPTRPTTRYLQRSMRLSYRLPLDRLSFFPYLFTCLFACFFTYFQGKVSLWESWLTWKSLCRLSWPPAHRDPPVSASWVPGLKLCTTMPSLIILFLFLYFSHYISHFKVSVLLSQTPKYWDYNWVPWHPVLPCAFKNTLSLSLRGTEKTVGPSCLGTTPGVHLLPS
jgi:hypothetical protein